ncbi:MAG: hypothetical protein U5L96_04775 [Owenweeksia sp.]|nr:hypothetical protein [Owenweeksia sp.]
MGNGDYEFTLKLYRDCTGADIFGNTQSISGPNGSITLNRVATNDLSPTCFGGGSGYGCPPTVTGANVIEGSVEEHVFRGTTSLSGVPPAGGWTFSWSLCL